MAERCQDARYGVAFAGNLAPVSSEHIDGFIYIDTDARDFFEKLIGFSAHVRDPDMCPTKVQAGVVTGIPTEAPEVAIGNSMRGHQSKIEGSS